MMSTVLLAVESIVADPDPHHFGKLDPDLDPHLSGKVDPDPHQSEQQDPHQSAKVEALEVIGWVKSGKK